MVNCGFIAGRGDKKCDDSNNVFECGWDGGDCCGCFTEEGICGECICRDPEYQKEKINYCCNRELMVNGICDNVNNNVYCQYDGLDCCSDVKRLKWDTQHVCPLQQQNCPMEKLLNYQCDSGVDQINCLYDMGQCCKNMSLSNMVEPGSICDSSVDGKSKTFLLTYDFNKSAIIFAQRFLSMGIT